MDQFVIAINNLGFVTIAVDLFKAGLFDRAESAYEALKGSAFDQDAAGGGLDQAEQRAAGRGRAAAAFPNQAQDLAGAEVLQSYDRYYLDRRGNRPLPVVRVSLADADHTRYYIDPRTGRLAGVYSDRNWVTRWLYHGLHSLDFPWLYAHRPLWDIVVIGFMLGGTGLGVTSLILTWRVIGRTLARVAAPPPRLGDDLA